ncbi:MAG: hypothetical protein HYZ28_17325 [Myxococcales bacterium]|nr:hypothetical protein [Myxococcales bacterium]
MANPRTRQPTILLLAALAVLGCGGSSSSGCSGLKPIPTGRYSGEKTDNAVTIRLSAGGINFLNSKWKELIEVFAPGQKLSFPFACAKQSVPVIGSVTIADQGGPSGGRNDDTCDSKDQPAIVDVTINGFNLLPRPPDSVDVTIQVTVDTGKIYLTKSCVKCSIDFNTARATPAVNQMRAVVKFTIDTKWDRLLAFEIAQMDGTKVCGASGALPKPQCFDPDDLSLNDECGCTLCGCYVCSFVCDVGDWDPIKTFLLEMMSPMLEGEIRKNIEKQSCESCGAGKPACPQLPNATSTCQSNVCKDTAPPNKCVPRFLGTEGRLTLASVMGSFGVPADAEMDLSVAAGSSVSMDQGINMGTRAGIVAVTTSDCVPPLAAPPILPVTPPNFDAEADPAKGPYHVGLGISSAFLNLATHHAHQSGSLCVTMTSASSGMLNTGLFKTFLPSLGRLATRDGKDAPMMVVLRPAAPPKLTVGQGTYDPVTKKPVKPLLLVTMTDLTVDFYAMFDDRFARLFSLTADISVPLSLIFENCSSVTPALGDLKQLITNIRTANSEILAEDPKVLADLIPAVIGLAEPAVAGALKPFALPQLGSFKLKVNEAKGLGNVVGTGTYDHLGIYAQLLTAGSACAVTSPRTLVTLKRSVIPPAERMRLRGEPLPWPVAVLDVRSLGMEGTPEFAYRIDGGMWTTFLAPSAQNELEVTHPAFLIQGQHVIEVRSRMAEHPHGISPPAAIGFRVDWEPPEVSLRVDRAAGLIEVNAQDVVSAPLALQYAYRVGGGEFGLFGPPRLIDLEAIELAGGVAVRVKDEAGNVGEAAYGMTAISSRPEQAGASALPGAAAGCTVAGGSLALLGTLGALGLMRRRRR